MIEGLINSCKNGRVWIQTHNFPDPDAIASAFGLQELLKNLGIEASLCYDGQIDKLSSSKMLTTLGIDLVSREFAESEMKEEDPIILVDCQKESGNTTDLIGDEVAAIDHHPTFVKIDYKYEDLRICGACASIIAEYYQKENIEPSPNVATALIYGIKMDTLHFSRGVTDFDIEMYGFLFPYCDARMLRTLETNNMEFKDLKAYSTAIDNIRVFNKIGFTFINYECPDALVAIISDFILSLAEVDVVVLYAKRNGGYKFSLRSEAKEVHVGKLANIALKEWGNGGGHAGMAGGFVPFEKAPVNEDYFFDAVQDHFLDEIDEMRRKYAERQASKVVLDR